MNNKTFIIVFKDDETVWERNADTMSIDDELGVYRLRNMNRTVLIASMDSVKYIQVEEDE